MSLSSSPAPALRLGASLRALRRSDGLGITTSTGALYAQAVFGRDSLVVASDLLEWEPALAREIILTHVRFQGTRTAPAGPRTSEEEPGRCFHEFRQRVMDGHGLPEAIRERYEAVAEMFGEQSVVIADAVLQPAILYYGTVDATPLFLRLVSRWCEAWGPSLLEETTLNKDGGVVSVAEAAAAAAGWIARNVDSSEVGLLEWRSRNPTGLPFQAWKDSEDAYLHVDGSPANSDAPIASVEVQGLAYDALLGAARLLGRAHSHAAEGWIRSARRIQAQTLELLWMPDRGCFAMALDRAADGRPRQVQTLTSNAALLLDSQLLLDLPATQRQRYVSALARHAFSGSMLTSAGIRCRSTDDRLLDFAAYHGSDVTWVKDTAEVARGLHRHGLDQLACELETRILNACAVAGDAFEYFYLDPAGTPVLDPGRRDPIAAPVYGTTLPETGQAWSVSALLAIKRSRRACAPAGAGTALENALLPVGMETSVLAAPQVISAREALPSARLELVEGRTREARFRGTAVALSAVS